MKEEEKLKISIEILEREMKKADHRTRRVLGMTLDYLRKRLEYPDGRIEIKLYVERGKWTTLVDEIDSDSMEFDEAIYQDEDDLGY